MSPHQPWPTTGPSAICPQTRQRLIRITYRRCTYCKIFTTIYGCCGTASFAPDKHFIIFRLWIRCWACEHDTVMHMVPTPGSNCNKQMEPWPARCEACRYRYDGSEVYIWKEQYLTWSVAVDLEVEEKKIKEMNRVEMASERYRALVECAGCGRMCKGERGVSAHRRYCSGLGG